MPEQLQTGRLEVIGYRVRCPECAYALRRLDQFSDVFDPAVFEAGSRARCRNCGANYRVPEIPNGATA